MAIFNSFYPASYQPLYPQPQYQQNAQQTGGIIWVQGEAGAKSYLVAPNTTVQLWDSENQTIYLKSADASGMPSIKTLDYTIRETAQNSAPVAQNPVAYATRDEVAALAGQIEALKGRLESMASRRTKKEAIADEPAV